MARLTTFLGRFRSESGVTSIEYALIASLISIAIVGSVVGSGNALQASLENTLSEIAAAFG